MAAMREKTRLLKLAAFTNIYCPRVIVIGTSCLNRRSDTVYFDVFVAENDHLLVVILLVYDRVWILGIPKYIFSFIAMDRDNWSCLTKCRDSVHLSILLR